MPDRNRVDVLHGPVEPVVLKLAAPMVFGIASVILFNVIDTLYVGRLGPKELAAMSFTFPITFLVMSISMGLSVGTSSVISRAIGQGEWSRVRRLTSDALLLAHLIVLVFVVLGLSTMEPVFRMMGASPETIDLVSRYMRPWYLGVIFLVVPMVGNGAIRATGDTKTPSLIMMIAGGINIVLDPFLIFGIGPFPKLGLVGAAYGTVVSWSFTSIAATWILSRRLKMISFSLPRASEVVRSWKAVLAVGVPSAGTAMLTPLAMAFVTRIVASHGESAVAGFGVGTRVESFAIVGSSALASGIAPFVGQNFGAKKCDRIRQAVRFATKVSFLWGLGAAVLLAVAAPWIAAAFNQDPTVQRAAVSYLRIVPLSYGAYGSALIISSVFNSSNHPLRSTLLIFIRMIVLVVPLVTLGSKWGDVTGLLVGLSVANLGVGWAGSLLVRKFLKESEEKFDRGESPQMGASVA